MPRPPAHAVPLSCLFALAVFAASSSAGCIDRDVAEVDLESPGEDGIDVEVGRPALDLLFVIDNSGSMTEEQQALAASFGSLVRVLEGVEGGLPDVHIGVISTDVGTGRTDILGCEGEGDDGTLQATPRGTCSGPDGRFLVSLDNGDGTRTTNFDGTLADTFGCIAQLGTRGCGFEQPLESMRRALDPGNADNVGFVRDGALLAVVFITDEDDCSPSDRALFDGSEPIGPLDDFRCFEQGVVCDGDDPREPGAKVECTTRDDSPYFEAVSAYAAFLRSLKDDPNDIVVAGIVGDIEPVSVVLNDGDADLGPSCSSAAGVADPPVRLAAFFDEFPNRNTAATICTADQTAALQQIAELISVVIPTACLPDNVADVDPDQPGLQVDCVVTDVAPDGTEMRLPPCESGAEPCFRIVTDGGECDARIEVSPAQRNLPAGTTTQARCAVE